MGSNIDIVNIKVDKCDTYIGRPTIWGNPYSHKKTGTLASFVTSTRSGAIEKYKKYILQRLVSEPNLRVAFDMEIRNKVLGCWCKPASCHGDVLKEIAEQVDAGIDFESQLKASGEQEAECTIKKYRPTKID